MKKTLWTTLITVVLIAACTKPESAPEPIRAVRVMTVTAGVAQGGQTYAAEVRPRIETRLGFRVAGKIIQRQAEVGQSVKPGQVLAQLDPKDYQLADSAAKAQVTAAQTNRDLAAADYKRYKDLRDQNFISGAELDRRDATLKAAQAQLEQAQAQQSAQGNQASYANLVADVAGIVTAIEAEPGQVVAAGAPVVRIAPNGARDVVFVVAEDKVGTIAKGQIVDVNLWATQTRLQGRVREVATTADPQTRTFAVKVALEGAGQAAPPLGSTVYATPQTPELAGVVVIKLPTSALKQSGTESAVWRLDKATMTVQSQPVQVGGAQGNEVVVTQGLNPGDVVVTAGVHVLAQGQKVTVYAEKAGIESTSKKSDGKNALLAVPAAFVESKSIANK